MTSDLSTFAARLLRNFHSGISSLRDDTAFNALALELFTLQFAHNAPYRRLGEARGKTPANVAHWTDIPAAPTSAFKELELSCLPVADRVAVFHSSGTTEQRPSRHFHSPESLAVYEAALWPWFREQVLAVDAAGPRRLAFLVPPPSAAPRSSLVHMFEVIRRQLGAPVSAFAGAVGVDGSWTLDFPAVLNALRESVDAHEPLLLLGTAFSFVHLLDFLSGANRRFELPPGSRVMETGGYKNRSRTLPKSELHALINDRLGIPSNNILCEYGMSELSSQAYVGVHASACRESTLKRELQPGTFRFPPWARVQILSPETGREVAEGETGLLRVIDLANVFSVLAVQTEDLAVRRGDGFELIGRAALAEARGCSLMTI
jgi:hypothetical protein